MSPRITSSALAAVSCAVATLGLAAPAAGQSPQESPPPPKPRQLSVDLTVDRFSVREGRAVARGSATTRLKTRDGKVRTTRRRVVMAVTAAARCQVLTLRLDDLQLELLGLDLNTSAINLRITGDKSRTLGGLFCRLSQGLRLNRATVSAAAARSLNRRMGRRPMRVLAVRASVAPSVQPSQAAPGGPSCQVLRLILGPLNLDLLGLIVDLYGSGRKKPVEILLTARANGGVLGSLFCQLANTDVTLRPRPS